MSYPPDYYADGSQYTPQPQEPDPSNQVYYDGVPQYSYPSSGQEGAGSVPAAYGGEAGAMGYGYDVSTSSAETSYGHHSQQFSSFPSSNPGHSRQRHEYRLTEGALSDRDADVYLQPPIGRNIYLCRWPGCQVHLSVNECTPACNQCLKRLHTSKEGARIHVRKEHYGRPELYECTVCPGKTFQRKADAKKHCDSRNGRIQ